MVAKHALRERTIALAMQSPNHAKAYANVAADMLYKAQQIEVLERAEKRKAKP